MDVALGLDLGSRTGVCAMALPAFKGAPWPPREAWMGVWDLSAGDFEGGAARFLRLKAFLARSLASYIFFERVRYTPSSSEGGLAAGGPTYMASRITSSAQLLGAFMATVGAFGEEHGVPAIEVVISDIKREAAGKGNASKDEVVLACDALYGTRLAAPPGEKVVWSDVADAVFCARWGLKRYQGAPDDF